jgi:hypothetical protein
VPFVLVDAGGELLVRDLAGEREEVVGLGGRQQAVDGHGVLN